MNIEIIYEDDDVVVINKPSGILMHQDRHHTGMTVADWHVARIPSVAEVGEPLRTPSEVIARPGVVHRLDAETSGVLLLVKHQDAFVHMKKQFHDRLVKKAYRAFVYGKMKEGEGKVTRPIGRSARDFRLRSAEKGAKGLLRDAYTEWKCLLTTSEHSYLELFPGTGRTHQLRVHLKSISHPIVADTLYAVSAMEQASDHLGFERLALHAHTLSVVLPADAPTGKQTLFTASLPGDFEHAENLLKDRLTS